MDSATCLASAQIADLRASLQAGGLPGDPTELIALIGELETLKSAACAIQAEASAAYDDRRRRDEADLGIPASRRGRGVAAEIALARREAPHRGQVLLGFAKVATGEMPHLTARLKDGSINEFRAMLALRETACLAVTDRAFVDEEVFADPDALEGVGTRRLLAQIKRLAYELDPKAIADRASNATRDRHVSIRPAPDTMVYLTALLPVAQGVAAHAALTQDATTMLSQGDERSKSQLTADLLVARLTGVADTGTTSEPPAVPVGINLILPAATLLGGHAPGMLEGEPVPAETARLLAAASLDSELDTWLRSVTVDHSGRLITMSSKQRCFPTGLSDFLAVRDQGICRAPYCGAPIRHSDHVLPHADDGVTAAANGQGLCEACNQAKQAAGWRQHATDHDIETVTPSGHRYRSRAPAPPGWRQPRYVHTRPGLYQLTA